MSDDVIYQPWELPESDDVAYWHKRADALELDLMQERARNDNFSDCLNRARKLYLAAHPNANGWPDGAESIAWMMGEEPLITAPPPCPDCGRPMTRREPWTCANCGEECEL